MSWSYMTKAKGPDDYGVNWDRFLNELGSSGWELVGIDGQLYVFKRCENKS